MKQFAAAKKCLCLANPKTKDPLSPLQWLFVGSAGDFFMLLIRPCPLQNDRLAFAVDFHLGNPFAGFVCVPSLCQPGSDRE
jgi:hypothetical protein